MLRKDCNLARMQQTTGDQRWVRYEVMVMVMCDQDQVYGCCKTGYILLATLYIHIHSPTRVWHSPQLRISTWCRAEPLKCSILWPHHFSKG